MGFGSFLHLSDLLLLGDDSGLDGSDSFDVSVGAGLLLSLLEFSLEGNNGLLILGDHVSLFLLLLGQLFVEVFDHRGTLHDFLFETGLVLLGSLDLLLDDDVVVLGDLDGLLELLVLLAHDLLLLHHVSVLLVKVDDCLFLLLDHIVHGLEGLLHLFDLLLGLVVLHFEDLDSSSGLLGLSDRNGIFELLVHLLEDFDGLDILGLLDGGLQVGVLGAGGLESLHEFLEPVELALLAVSGGFGSLFSGFLELLDDNTHLFLGTAESD